MLCHVLWHGLSSMCCLLLQVLLMFDRWSKLCKSFYSEKKGFDISKV